MRSTYRLASVLALLALLLSVLPGPVAPVAAAPPPPRQPGAAESEPDAIQMSPMTSGHSGAYGLTDSPQGNYAPNVDISARIAQAFDFRGATSASLSFWHRYYLGPAAAVLPHTGSHVLTDSPAGNYANSANISARITQAFNFSSVANPHLTFWHYHRLESGYDNLRVEASTDGTTWTQLAAYTGSEPSYTQADINLSAYVGQPTVYLRFRLTTDGSVVYDGWVMDDLIVKDGTTTLFSDGFETGTLAWVLDSPWAAAVGGTDRTSVQVSLDGNTWNDLASYQGTVASYSQVSLDLAAYLGQPSIRFRWRLLTNAVDSYDGWYVDDVAVNVSGSTVFSDDFESGTSKWTLGAPWGLTVPSTVAYVRSNSAGMSTVADDLEELRSRGALPDYDVFTETNINDLWANLNQYRTILMEEDIIYEWSNPCSPSCADPIPVTGVGLSIYNHRQQLGDWIKGGGGLFATDQNDVSGSSEMAWAWLPDDLRVTSKNTRDGGSTTANLNVAYDPGLFSYPNTIDVTRVSAGEAHGEFLSFPGYTAMIRDNRGAPMDDVLEIYRYYGSGVIVLSHLEYETADYACGSGHTCDADYVENEFHFLRVSVQATATYPNSSGKLDIFAAATSSSLGDLVPANTQSATYDIRAANNAPTGLTGALSYDATQKRWRALNIDVSALGTGRFSILVTFVDTGGDTGSGAGTFRKGLPNGQIGLSTPSARSGDTVMVYATVWDGQGARIVNSDQVTVRLTGVANPFRLYDDQSNGDLHAQDGEYGAWQAVSGSGNLEVVLYYQGEELSRTSLALINDPQLIVLTDIEDLYNEFIDTGTGATDDQDSNRVIDFYDLLGRLRQYAAAHRGIVYDLSHEITTANGYANNYSALTYGGVTNTSNRFQMGRLIDRFVEQIDLDTQQNGRHKIQAIALIGDDRVVPFHRRDDPSNSERDYPSQYVAEYGGPADIPTMTDSGNDFIMTDIPYSTWSAADPANENRPRPDVAVGRVFAERPISLTLEINAYDTRLRLDDDGSTAALFHLRTNNPSRSWDRIDWATVGNDALVPAVSPPLDAGDINHTPPFEAGHYYRYDGNIATWTPISVTTTIPQVDISVLYSHADHVSILTEGADLVASDYDRMADSAQKILVSAGCHSGYSVSHLSPSSTFAAFDNAMVNSILAKRAAYLAPSAYGWAAARARQLTFLLTSSFVDAILTATSSSVGDAWRRAYEDYWEGSGAGSGTTTTVAYGTMLYGLPTQAIEHVMGAQAQVAELASMASLEMTAPQIVRSFTLVVDVPNFTTEFDEQGRALVLPGNGGSTFAQPNGPILPQILTRFVLPLGASGLTIVENQASRVSQNYGDVQLQTAVPINSQGPHPGPFTIPSPYPSQAFWYDVYDHEDGLSVALSAIPAQYQPTHQLTLFTHMEFNVSYTLPTPAAAINNVVLNNGQPVQISQPSLPLKVAVATAQAQSLRVQFEVVDPSGYAIASASEIVPVLAGSSQITFDLDSSGWAPGPKTLWVSVGNESGVLDSWISTFSAVGIRVEASVTDPSVGQGMPVHLVMGVRDENGALVGGLANRFTIMLDGVAVHPTVTQQSPGVYLADLPTSNLALGLHQVIAQASDLRSITGQGITEFSLGINKIWLPVVLRQR